MAQIHQYKVSIDCPNCAKKVENALQKTNGIEEANFNFAKGLLTVTSDLSDAEIKKICLSVEDEMQFLDGPATSRYDFKVEIDCPNCAKKVENALNDHCAVENAVFNFTKGTLMVETTLSEKEIKEICLSVEDEMKFLEEEECHNYSFQVEIDCANCAKKVENALNENPAVAKAVFNFTKGSLQVETTLSEQEVKDFCHTIEDDMKFLEETKNYSFQVEIDCANCAKKVENALNANEKVKKADFNFSKGILHVETSLSEDEIKAICLEVEDEMVFKAEEKDYLFSVSIDCVECAQEVQEALEKHPSVSKASFNFPKGKLSVTTSLSEEEIKKICLDVEEDMVFHEEVVKKEKDIAPYRIGLALLFLAVAYLLHMEWIAIIGYLIAGYDVLYKAFKNITKGSIFDENFLMAIATIGACCISSYTEAAGVMIFYQIGEYFQRRAVGASRESIGKLMDLSAEKATVLLNGEWVDVKPETIKVGDKVQIKSGEKVAVDGTVLEGTSFVDTRALTGESVPVKMAPGTKILSGSVNGDATLIIEATNAYADSTASKILRLVDESEGKKAQSEKFITKFSRYYTPAVCAAAVLIAVLPPLFGLSSLAESLYKACMLLVISCPCALVLSVPLTYFASMGSFAKHGILVKGDDAIQKLSKMNAIAMDKTGTLTEGVFTVQSMEELKSEESHLIAVAAALEKESTHPIATAILSYAGSTKLEAKAVKNIPGIGLEGMVEGKLVRVGSAKIMDKAPLLKKEGTHIYVTEEGKLLGILVISDKIREESYQTIRSMRELGVKEITMLSGDRKERAEKTAEKLGMDKAIGELLPQDKLVALESLMGEGKTVGYVGDGINDAPSLKRADVGIAMGGVGSDVAIEAADAVIMNDEIKKIPVAIGIARKTEAICKENIWISLLIKAAVFVLAIFGLSNMWFAVFADTGVCIIAVVNAMRALRYKEN